MAKKETKISDNKKVKAVIDAEPWYGLEEIAVHKDTIRAWIKKGSIPYYKIGRQYKFKLTEVDAWVESGQSADADK